MKLYICGNGFDLHHGYNTGYCNYRSFLLEYHYDACDIGGPQRSFIR
ncbi:AbiH family protein [Desulfitobacterium sp. Sab5]